MARVGAVANKLFDSSPPTLVLLRYCTTLYNNIKREKEREREREIKKRKREKKVSWPFESVCCCAETRATKPKLWRQYSKEEKGREGIMLVCGATIIIIIITTTDTI